MGFLRRNILIDLTAIDASMAASLTVTFKNLVTEPSDGQIEVPIPKPVVTDSDGLATVSLPCKQSGTVEYLCRITNSAGTLLNNPPRKFFLNYQDGSDKLLADLWAGGTEATDTVTDYIDEQIAAIPGGGGDGASNTDELPEGSTNKYFTSARVWAVVLTGLSFATNSAILATDSILVAFGKLQAQITALLASLSSHTSNSSNPHSVTKTQVGLGSVVNADTTTTANITDSLNKRFVTDANLTTIGNQSGTNTGDQDLSGYQTTANKSTDVNADQASATKYPTVKAVYDWAISLFVQKNGSITGATKTKITYDAKGLVTSGADATQDDIGDGTTNKQYSATDKTKLSGIANSATANSSDATLLNRANHTGTQLSSTISDFNSAALVAAPAETATTIGTIVAGLAGKTTPVNADYFSIYDSVASALKVLTFTNLKAFLKTYFDGLYPSGSGTSTGTNTGDQTTVTGNAGTATTLQTSRNIDGQAFNGSTDITVIAPGTHAATSKATPVNADELPLIDSAASSVLKKLTWQNLLATAKTYFDTIYQSPLVSGTNIKTINSSSILGSGNLVVSGGISSINSDSIAAQVISGNDDISIATSGGTTTARRTAITGANVKVMLPLDYPSAGQTATGTANQVRVWAFTVKDRTTINQIIFNLSGSSASQFVACGIYSSDGNTKLADTGAISTTSTGNKVTTLGAAVTLIPGLRYFLAMTYSDATASVYGYVRDATAIGVLNAGTNIFSATAANASASGVLPSTLGVLTAASFNVWWVSLLG